MLFIKRAFLVLQIIVGVSSLLLFTSFKSNSPYQIEKKIFIPQSHLEKSRYFYVPFEVPAGTKSLTVSYEYDRKGGANTLDLGVFDSCFSKAENDLCGFRGWSGGQRSTVFIAEDSATNGYIPGKMPNGVWRVILGLYKVAPEGVEVTVKVRLDEIGEQAAKELAAEQAKTFDFPKLTRTAPLKANDLTWYRGDLHLHTFHSDGRWTIKGILDYADGNNLDFVGITEHNTYSHHREIDRLAPAYKNLLVMRGEEVTTYGGHFNVWGLKSGKLVDWRVKPQHTTELISVMQGAMYKESFGLGDVVSGKAYTKLFASINHPAAMCGGCDWSYGDEVWNGFGKAEIWNGSWDLQDENALKKWDEVLKSGKLITAIGSSDSHVPPNTDKLAGSPLGLPTTFVGAKALSEKEILEAIEKGRVWLAENPTAYSLNFTGEIGKKRALLGDVLPVPANASVKLKFSGTGFPAGATVSLSSKGEILQKTTLDKADFALEYNAKPNGSDYFRIEVRDASGKMLAFTNPIYTRNK